MDAKALASDGPLKHFTMRDIFYFAGAVGTVIITLTNFNSKVLQIEKDTTREITELKIQTATITKTLVDLDHNGTTASKNGIYNESEVSKANSARLTALEKDSREYGYKIERIDANLQLLMRQQGIIPSTSPSK